jgi:myo-inositol-1-phosphate synthase
MGSVRVAVVGVGNCATSLIQGVEYYRDADPEGSVPGLMHVRFGDYHVGDIEFVAAFDVDAKKVGFDLSEATQASENNTIKIADVAPLGVPVLRGPTYDGLGRYYRETIEESEADPVDVVAVLREARADVLVAYLPVGSEEADKFYAQCAIDAGVAFVNALPVFIASDPVWARKFTDAGVPDPVPVRRLLGLHRLEDSSSSPATPSPSWVCGRCTSCSQTSSTASSTSRRAWLRSWCS